MTHHQSAQLYFYNQVKQLEEELSDFPKRLKKKKVHEIRVALHRILSLLGLTKIKSPGLKKMDKALGKVRDMDVAIQNAHHYKLDDSELVHNRKKHEKKAEKLIRKKSKSLLKELRADNEKFEGQFDLKSTSEDLHHSLQEIDPKIPEKELHEIRIQLKKVRYLFEAAGRSVKKLKNMQDLLGEVHDLQVLETYFNKERHLINDQKIKTLKARKVVGPGLKNLERTLRRLETQTKESV